jgi:hypothetical protein
MTWRVCAGLRTAMAATAICAGGGLALAACGGSTGTVSGQVLVNI